MTKTRLARRGVVALIAFLLLIQLIPYGHSSANPPVTKAVRFDSPQTAKLFAQACQDCHSNLTNWRWYDKIAPASWLVQHDIQDGRGRLNVSEWNRAQPPIDEVVQAIKSGHMPPLQYKLVHAGGRLSKAQADALARGMEATYKKDRPPIAQHDHGD
jgi:mono/diheme cytochrome c family protein